MNDFKVALHPGRAVISHPLSNFDVELEFEWRANERSTKIYRARVVGAVPDTIDFVPYVEALREKIYSAPIASTLRTPKRRPQPGKPADGDFYTSIVGLHNRFTLEGYSNPSAEIGKLMNESADVVRLWVHRGRKYLEKAEAK